MFQLQNSKQQLSYWNVVLNEIVLKERKPFPGIFLTSLRSKGFSFGRSIVLGCEYCCCRSQPGPFMLVAAGRQRCPTGLVPGPHKRKGEPLLCGGVHYGQDLSQLQDGSCAIKWDCSAEALHKCGRCCYELLRISWCSWCWALSEKKSRKAFNMSVSLWQIMWRVVASGSALSFWHWYYCHSLLGALSFVEYVYSLIFSWIAES